MCSSIQTNQIPSTYPLSPINTPFLQYVYEAAVEHNRKYEPCIFKHLPRLQDIDEPCSFGVYSYTLQKSKLQFLLQSGTVNIGGAYTTITDVSRRYLDYYYPNRLRAFGALNRATYELPNVPPTFVNPSIIQEGTYVDIKSAYYSMLTILGWDLSVYQGKWLTPGTMLSPFPLDNVKPARSYLVTGCLKKTVGMWTGERMLWKKVRNKHLNYQLWGCVQAVLHSIAQYAVLNCDARYVHTDGYIVPEKYAERLIAHIANYGLKAEVKASGIAWIAGFANYHVGEKSTKSFHAERMSKPRDTIRYDVPARWYMDNVARIAATRT